MTIVVLLLDLLGGIFQNVISVVVWLANFCRITFLAPIFKF